jgi:acyl carrier protein
MGSSSDSLTPEQPQVSSAGDIEEAIYRAIRKVKPALASIPLDPSTPVASLGLESLERAIVVFEIEDAFEVSLVDEGLDRFRTIAEGRDIVLTLLAKKAQA